MTFENLQVALDGVPRAAALEYEPMDRAYPREVVIQSIIVWGCILLVASLPALLIAKPESLALRLVWIPLGLLLLAALSTFVAWRGALVQAVALRDHDIAFRSGLIWRKTVIMPFSRIQHIEVSQGPLQRRFDLGTLKFFTAGGAHVDMQISGLRHQRAVDLRQQILAKADRAAAQAIHD